MWSGRKLGIMKTLGPSQICHLDRSVAQWRDLRFRRLRRIEAYTIFTNDNRPGWNPAPHPPPIASSFYFWDDVEG
jgi:hypothetical protein